MANSASAVQLVKGADAAAALLHPLRLKLLRRLEETNSASSLARDMSIPRQKINYHLRELEKAGLVSCVGRRKKGNCIERLIRATARSYLISPEALGDMAADPSQIGDRFSASYMVAVAARTIRDLAVLQRRAAKAGKKLATLNLQADVRFATAADRNAFAEELSQFMAHLAAKYHDEKTADGRLFRFFLGAYPAITKIEDDDNDAKTSSTRME
ncbi:MAG: transcriptional regulator [Planctomycetota bacterium]|nr:MAG: transcriptional regulator [Planctomycetota bacterium]